MVRSREYIYRTHSLEDQRDEERFSIIMPFKTFGDVPPLVSNKIWICLTTYCYWHWRVCLAHVFVDKNRDMYEAYPRGSPRRDVDRIILEELDGSR